jgi:hypothetical protein
MSTAGISVHKNVKATNRTSLSTGKLALHSEIHIHMHTKPNRLAISDQTTPCTRSPRQLSQQDYTFFDHNWKLCFLEPHSPTALIIVSEIKADEWIL